MLGVLYTDGTKIMNFKGEEVIWCGITSRSIFGYWEYGCKEEFLHRDDIRIIREHGLNLIRVSFKLDAMVYGQPLGTPMNINYRPRFWELLDEIVDAGEEYGVWISLHFGTVNWSPYFGASGFPPWMFDGTWEYGLYYNPDIVGKSQSIKDFFNIDDPKAENIRQTYITMWKDIANRYKNRGHVIFSLMNEPMNQEGGPGLWNTEEEQHHAALMYRDFMERTIDAIRNIDRGRHLIIINQAYLWYFDWNEKIRRPNVVIENHRYGETNYYIQRDYANHAWRYNQPFEFGEFGGVEAGLTTFQGTQDFIRNCYILRKNDGTLQPVGWMYLRYNPDTTGGGPTPSDIIWDLMEQNLYSDIKYPESTPASALGSILTRIFGPIGIGLYFIVRTPRRG